MFSRGFYVNMLSMVVKVSKSSPSILSYFPKLKNLIPNFVDALVSLRPEPKAEFTNKLNEVVLALTPDDDVEDNHDWGNQLYKIFFNKDLVKFLKPDSLFHLLKILVLDNLGKKTRSVTEENIKNLFDNLHRYNYETAFINILEVLRDFYGIKNPSKLLCDYWSDEKAGSGIFAIAGDHFQPEEIFPSDVKINTMRTMASWCERKLDTIDQDLFDHDPETINEDLLSALRYFRENENIIPAFKILNLRPLVSVLDVFIRLGNTSVHKEIATELDKELMSRAPKEQLDDYKKLALAVFPNDIAGRLRAAGFAPSSKA